MVRSLPTKLAVLGFTVAVVFLFAASMLPLPGFAKSPAVVIPYGTCDSLDGVIGTEWNTSLKKSTTIQFQKTSCDCSASEFPAEIYFLHDEENLYVGISIRTSTAYSSREMLRAFVFVDKGDTMLWSAGDNIIIVPAKNGQLLTTGLDYHYPSYTSSPISAATLDAEQNATGVGRWNAAKGAYEFEIRFPLQSGDPFDVPILVGRPLILVVGFDVVTRHGMSMYYGKTRSMPAVLAP